MITDLLKHGGTVELLIDKLTIFVIIGDNTFWQLLTIEVGIGSREHCLLGLDLTIFEISSSVTASKTE